MNRPGNSLILTVSRRRIREWGLKDGAKVPVRCGRLQGDAVVQELDTDEERSSLQWSRGRLDWERDGLAGAGAERHAYQRTAVTGFQFDQRSSLVTNASQALRKLTRGNQDINQG